MQWQIKGGWRMVETPLYCLVFLIRVVVVFEHNKKSNSGQHKGCRNESDKIINDRPNYCEGDNMRLYQARHATAHEKRQEERC